MIFYVLPKYIDDDFMNYNWEMCGTSENLRKSDRDFYATVL